MCVIGVRPNVTRTAMVANAIVLNPLSKIHRVRRLMLFSVRDVRTPVVSHSSNVFSFAQLMAFSHSADAKTKTRIEVSTVDTGSDTSTFKAPPKSTVSS